MKPKFLFAFIIIVLLLPYHIDAAPHRFKASVVDANGNPEEYITWRIYPRDSTEVKPVCANLTDENGCIETTLPSAGYYRIIIQRLTNGHTELSFMISDTTSCLDLGLIELPAAESTLLDEITVSAQKPIVVKSIDRIAYDIKADPEALTSPLIDILRKVPMVTVDAEGNITVNGSSDFKIYKNGRPNNSFTKNAKEIFKAIPASSIKKVEVITDPGAREDAEGVGAIINIITDNNACLDSTTGSISLYDDSNNFTPSPNIWVSSQIDRVAVSFNGGYHNMNHRESTQTAHHEAHYLDTGNTLEYDEHSEATSDIFYAGIDLSYEPDTLNLISLSVNAFNSNTTNDFNRDYTMYDHQTSTFSSYTMQSSFPKACYTDIDGEINYRRSTARKGENITLSYQISTTSQKQLQTTDYSNIINFPIGYSGIYYDSDLKFMSHTFQIDWCRPLAADHTVGMGAKYILRRNHSQSTRDYIDSHQTADDFYHNTDIAAAYAEYTGHFGKFSLRAGIRYEFSRLAAKFKIGDADDFHNNISDYVPKASLNYKPDETNSFKLAFTRRISRPGINQLDPTVDRTPNTTYQGNPSLSSANFNSIELNYGLIKPKFFLDASIQFRFSDNMIAQTLTNLNNHLYYCYDNIGRLRQLNAHFTLQWTPFDNTTINSGFYYSFISQSMPDGSKVNRPMYNPDLRISQKLPFRMRLFANIGWWSGGVINAYSYTRPGISFFWNVFTIQKSFLSDDRLSASFRLTNPFGPYKRTDTTITNSPNYNSVTEPCFSRNFTFGFALSYRFGALKTSVKKHASAINNDDLESRKK